MSFKSTLTLVLSAQRGVEIILHREQSKHGWEYNSKTFELGYHIFSMHSCEFCFEQWWSRFHALSLALAWISNGKCRNELFSECRFTIDGSFIFYGFLFDFYELRNRNNLDPTYIVIK